MNKTKQEIKDFKEFKDYLKKPVCWAVLEGMCMAAPWAVLLVLLPEILEHNVSCSQFSFYFLLLLSLLGFRFLVSLISNKKASQGGYETGNALRLRLGDHLRKMPMGFFTRRTIGELTNRIFMNVQMLEMMISHFLVQTVSNLAMPFVMLIFLFWMTPGLAMISLGSLVPAGCFLWLLIRMLAGLGAEKIQVQDKANACILEYLHGIKVFKSFNLTETGLARLHKALSRLRDFSLNLEIRSFALSLTYSAILETGFVLILFIGIRQMQQGSISSSVFFSFLILCRMFYRPLHELATNAALTRATIADARAVMKILHKSPVLVPEHPLPVSVFDIDFSDVSFGYETRNNILSHINFKARENNLTALVGPSGSGKSTLVNLAARFWDVGSGKISVGGNDIRRIDPDNLLQHISLVSQDVYLFNDSIADNIGTGRESASRQEIIQAAKTAQCHEFISALPDGYDTMVGEGGNTLSGGEKQRIAIARALLKDAPIVLLDEATASLDAENDLLIQKAIDGLVRSKTVLVVAHRLHTVMKADKIIVLENGTVKESGCHQDLLAQQGLYARMWNEQQSFNHSEIVG